MICLRSMRFSPNSFLCQFITPESQRLFKKYSPIAKTAILPDRAMRPFSEKKNGRTEVQQDSTKKGSTVEVYVDGKLTYSYSLDKNRTFEVDCDNGKNVVEIKDGKVSVIDADCNNRACVKSKAISKKGEQIVCLPHKLIVVIKGGSEGELDART